MKRAKFYAFCLECCGGGKKLAPAAGKKAAEKEATSHVKTCGHNVTILEDRAHD